ncbi:TniQ family protein [Bacillus sp. RG28]|uniref:TniQ family protein n=1 Tax=Gottfriedia endophytica TaxID=2820819 RepID=A0A940NQ20_9BACI|nr:TniQ family protein [Gottfriedia endophytica]MBP0726711.1 TniQ family protein [Gottfriedia endophytica]
MKKSLLFYTNPFLKESLPSFLYRTAAINLMENLDWIFENYESVYHTKLNRNEVNWLDIEELNKVAEFLNISVNNIHTMSFKMLLSQLNLSFKNPSTNHWFQYINSRFCPSCIKENPHQKIDWMSSYSIVCLNHYCFLLDQCQQCKKKITSKQIVLNKCTCGMKLSNNKTPKVSANRKFIHFQTILEAVIYQNQIIIQNNLIRDCRLFMDALLFFCTWSSQLILPGLLSVFEYNMVFTNNVISGTRLKNSLSIDQTVCLINIAYDILMNWPNGYFNFIDKISENKSTKFSSFIQNIIPSLKTTALKEISDSLTIYYKEKLNLPRDDMYLRSDEVYPLFSQLHKTLVHSEFINNRVYNHNGIIIKLSSLKELEYKNDLANKCMSKEELRSRWGTSPKATFDILSKGCIKDAVHSKMGSVNHWIIPTSSVTEIEKKLFERPINHIESHDRISLNEAFQWVGVNHANEILHGLMNKSIDILSLSQKLGNIIISKKSCYFYIEDLINRRAGLENCISIRDLTFILGVKKSDIYFWIQTGRFGESLINLDTSNNIPLENFNIFYNKYVTTFQFSLKYNLKIQTILKKVKFGSITTISGPLHNDGKRLLFKKTSNYLEGV